MAARLLWPEAQAKAARLTLTELADGLEETAGRILHCSNNLDQAKLARAIEVLRALDRLAK
jgi:hypothetical protein